MVEQNLAGYNTNVISNTKKIQFLKFAQAVKSYLDMHYYNEEAIPNKKRFQAVQTGMTLAKQRASNQMNRT